MAEAAELHDLRSEIRGWLEQNCPETMRRPGQILSGGEKEPIENPDSRVWLERCAERGYTVANWPREYGGAGFSMDEFLVRVQELLASLSVRTTPSGGIAIEAPPEAAATLASLFGAMAKMLTQQSRTHR